MVWKLWQNCVEDGKIALVCESTNFEKKAKSTQILHITIFVAYDVLESFLLKSLDCEDVENERKYIDTMYNEELNYHSLTNEIDTLKVILNGNIVECFDDISKCVKGQQH